MNEWWPVNKSTLLTQEEACLQRSQYDERFSRYASHIQGDKQIILAWYLKLDEKISTTYTPLGQLCPKVTKFTCQQLSKLTNSNVREHLVCLTHTYISWLGRVTSQESQNQPYNDFFFLLWLKRMIYNMVQRCWVLKCHCIWTEPARLAVPPPPLVQDSYLTYTTVEWIL